MSKEDLLIQAIKDYLFSLPDDEARKDFVNRIRDFVCVECGSTDMPCWCMRDD